MSEMAAAAVTAAAIRNVAALLKGVQLDVECTCSVCSTWICQSSLSTSCLQDDTAQQLPSLSNPNFEQW